MNCDAPAGGDGCEPGGADCGFEVPDDGEDGWPLEDGAGCDADEVEDVG
jgi:hypothetical protein